MLMNVNEDKTFIALACYLPYFSRPWFNRLSGSVSFYRK